MKLARVIGTVTATAKEAPLVGLPLLLCETVDGAGKVIDPALIAADAVGAGPGDQVLIATGSAARQSPRTSGAPMDALVAAIVDHVDLA